MQKVKAGLFAKKEIKTAYLLLAVPLGWWLVTGLFPILWGIGLSFCEWTGLGNSPIVNWGENFIIFFSSDIYVMSLVRSFLLGGGAFVLTTGSGFFIAFLLNKISKGKTLLRTIWYVPVVTSAVATTQIFNTLLDPFTGVINNIVKNLGGEPIVWMD
ncbi:MAG: carbohydrate ABC transporter permease, partial [Christensenellales bacterium]